MSPKKLSTLVSIAYTGKAPLVKHQSAAACALRCALSVETYLKEGNLDLALAAIRNAAGFERDSREAT